MDKGDAVLVEWTDAVADFGWKDGEEITTDPASVVSVGILLDEDEEALTIGLNVIPANGHVNGTMTIPWPWILDLTRLRKNVLRG